LEATQARSVLWMYVDYDSSNVVSCWDEDTSSTPTLVQPADITRTQYTKFRLCSTS
jgi:hypothetical protein